MSFMTNVGPSGHGLAFQYLARAIEEKLSSLLGRNMSLNRHAGFIWDITHGQQLSCRPMLQIFHPHIVQNQWWGIQVRDECWLEITKRRIERTGRDYKRRRSFNGRPTRL